MSEELTGLTHAQPRQAELEAAEKVAPYLAGMKGGIVAMMSNRGAFGLTPDEYAMETGSLINTVRRRFTDLWKEGIIKPTDRVRANARGNSETVWVVGRDEAGVSPRETKDQKIKRLEAALVVPKPSGCDHGIFDWACRECLLTRIVQMEGRVA